MSDSNWYAIKAIYGRALYVKDMLRKRSIASYVPMENRVGYLGRNTTTKLVPIFTNLIFVYTEDSIIRDLVRNHDYMHHMYRKVDGVNVPSIIPEDEMFRFISFVENREAELERVNCEDIDFSKGEKVRVCQGSFKGKEAIFTRVKGKRSRQVVITLGDYLAMRIEIDPAHLEKITD